MVASVALGLQRREVGAFGGLLDASLDQGSVRHCLKKTGHRWIEQVTRPPPVDPACAQVCRLAHTNSSLALNLLCSHVWPVRIILLPPSPGVTWFIWC